MIGSFGKPPTVEQALTKLRVATEHLVDLQQHRARHARAERAAIDEMAKLKPAIDDAQNAVRDAQIGLENALRREWVED